MSLNMRGSGHPSDAVASNSYQGDRDRSRALAGSFTGSHVGSPARVLVLLMRSSLDILLDKVSNYSESLQ